MSKSVSTSVATSASISNSVNPAIPPADRATSATLRDIQATSTPVSDATPDTTSTSVAQQPASSEHAASGQTEPNYAPSNTYLAQPTPAELGENSPDVARLLPEWPNLIPIQIKALDLLAAGVPIGRVAATLNVHRGTIHRWKTQHPAFIAAINRRRQDELDTLSARCTGILHDALKLLQKDMKRRRSPHDRQRAALAIVAAFGSRKFILPAGPTTPMSAVRHLTIQRRIEERAPVNTPIPLSEIDCVWAELKNDFYSEYKGEIEPNTP